jgi:HSP20 family protein
MRAMIPWRPFRELSTLHEDIDDIFSRFFGTEEERFPTSWRGMAVPLESFVREGELVLRADLPGIDPKKVELAVEGRRLTLSGERERKEEHKGRDYLRQEVTYGRFERAVELPEGVDTDSIKATYHDGVLEITMKAPNELAAKKVPIAVH